MKLSDLEDADNVVAKIDLDRLKNELIARFNNVDARINTLEAKLDGNHNTLSANLDRLSAKIDRVGRTIWVPALAAVAQLLLLAFHKKLGL